MAKPSVNNLIKRVQKTRHGFTDIKKAADELFARHPRDIVLEVAEELYTSGVYQARMLAVLLFARLAVESKESIKFLRVRVSVDADWRVQEMLAQAIDRICADMGYEQALPLIKEWLGDSNPNVRRAVSEGLRVWTARSYFRDHPQVAIQLLSSLRGDDSRYVRNSVGNALRDISRKHKDLIVKELKSWNQGSKEVMQAYAQAMTKIIGDPIELPPLADKLLTQGPSALKTPEKFRLLTDPDTMSRLHHQAWLRPNQTLALSWQKAIRRYAR